MSNVFAFGLYLSKPPGLGTNGASSHPETKMIKEKIKKETDFK
jgi:hypothetical protein